MNPKTTGILFVAAALLFVFVYCYEIEGAPERLRREEQTQQLFSDVVDDAIDWIALTATDGEQARVERRDGRWVVIEPLEFPGDAITLDGMASTLATLTSDAEVLEPQALSVYGLDDESRTITFGGKAGEYGLRLGSKTPVGSNSYVATRGSDRVFMVPTWHFNSISHSLDELRDRRVLDFDRAGIDRLDIRWPGGGVVVERRGEQWWTLEPVEARADEDTLETLLSDLSFLRAEGFVDDPPSDADAGLDRPEFEIRLRGGGDDAAEVHLAFGRAVDENLRLVRGMHPSLYRVSAQRLSDFPRTLAAYRFKRLASFSAVDAKRFEIDFRAQDGETLEIAGVLGDAGWTTTPLAMAAGKAETLVRELSRLKGSDVLADAVGEQELSGLGLGPPRVVIRVFGETSEDAEEPPRLAEVLLGTIDPDHGIAARAADGPMVYWVDKEMAEHLPVSLDAFHNRFESAEAQVLVEPAAPEDQSVGDPLESLDLLD